MPRININCNFPQVLFAKNDSMFKFFLISSSELIRNRVQRIKKRCDFYISFLFCSKQQPITAGKYILPFPPPLGGRKEIKKLKMGKRNQKEKEEKKGIKEMKMSIQNKNKFESGIQL